MSFQYIKACTFHVGLEMSLLYFLVGIGLLHSQPVSEYTSSSTLLRSILLQISISALGRYFLDKPFSRIQKLADISCIHLLYVYVMLLYTYSISKWEPPPSLHSIYAIVSSAECGICFSIGQSGRLAVAKPLRYGLRILGQDALPGPTLSQACFLKMAWDVGILPWTD